MGYYIFFALSLSGFLIFAYEYLPLGEVTHPEIKATFLTHPWAIYSHVFASIIALSIGLFQFSVNLRKKQPNLHRSLGRIYLAIGVLIGGISGLYLAQYAFGGIIAKFGFTLLAIAWLYTGIQAYLAIRQGDIQQHRKWMIYNYALTFAAVMLRLYLPILIIIGIDFTLA